jgi:hypothetical protein
MMRVKMRCVSLAIVCLVGFVAYGGCASEEGGQVFDTGDGGDTCNVAMCMGQEQGMGVPCCVGTQCGLNFGTGCIANAPDGS